MAEASVTQMDEIKRDIKFDRSGHGLVSPTPADRGIDGEEKKTMSEVKRKGKDLRLKADKGKVVFLLNFSYSQPHTVNKLQQQFIKGIPENATDPSYSMLFSRASAGTD
ncbi:hypothetical protein AOLI_G00264220 [Acnodon oligacanthus]